MFPWTDNHDNPLILPRGSENLEEISNNPDYINELNTCTIRQILKARVIGAIMTFVVLGLFFAMGVFRLGFDVVAVLFSALVSIIIGLFTYCSIVFFSYSHYVKKLNIKYATSPEKKKTSNKTKVIIAVSLIMLALIALLLYVLSN